MAEPPQNPYEPPKTDELLERPNARPPSGDRQRGGCLTAMLVLMMIANPLVAILYLASGDAIKQTLHAPDWAIPALGIAAITNFFCALGIWRFKRWGLYGSIAMAAIGLAVNVTIGIQPVQAIMGLLGPVLLVVLVRPQWQNFD